MKLTLPTLLLTTLLSSASADFFVSNTSVCMGAFLISNCYQGVKVLSGINNNTDYNCGKLIHAEDNNYVHKGYMGPYGDLELSSEGGICGSGRLDFVKDNMVYIVKNERGETVANCRQDGGTLARSCNQWVGMLFFNSTWRCEGSVCS